MGSDFAEEVKSGNACERTIENEGLEAVQELVVVFVGKVLLLDCLAENTFE
jgi:hypothetical protein